MFARFPAGFGGVTPAGSVFAVQAHFAALVAAPLAGKTVAAVVLFPGGALLLRHKHQHFAAPHADKRHNTSMDFHSIYPVAAGNQ